VDATPLRAVELSEPEASSRFYWNKKAAGASGSYKPTPRRAPLLLCSAELFNSAIASLGGHGSPFFRFISKNMLSESVRIYSVVLLKKYLQSQQDQVFQTKALSIHP
jgi:hypothetical protein